MLHRDVSNEEPDYTVSHRPHPVAQQVSSVLYLQLACQQQVAVSSGLCPNVCTLLVF
jgi:hypothetical protein